ncbi:GalNAc-alpha-(1,4)-GalNAc-alpha-(1,3)-diNAcBac-PP-undecaprenol alpha-1,4-N-acetyl-D-galactosaminyltransferase [Campylobacter pinnipediorum subsp. caledonicus]|uniref:GalNAc-alpha-(1,4)-GalNAc-alpha-(1, 3)-diNAcBac-PP-undecaprenol alpha-1,4-N-acetyl-D-galactosaminyltransferase n=1 Tax=Campylobacter pinnipediorum subsp. caledonicus TaxID=1874362 RepID=A0A1S6U7F3_9BACT|nr:glycosyltransferase [Campylobacter pinnipediorum]AQW86064.1 GalNAc-alpha-(1,4)-GalNAc-alpha-(1,3)-diNAcBac-PP-undecaprenol alpha-1,4-N-acetyl-D-galactosaminyltransferase [Campylobacter pinnipediorum subsp. caledonicus]AQW87671.1 GalNAc-alpha-(1,4)-GalNAc-alpha-(1,3)-diNAcBac-PP-undecaprenol alpha-1,4-N-acetyl-D-galactosaminyltransferase [Campylobacter pinnipediorum subsp. caledonicus]OPA72199.1 general glycosylation pathway protein [Campylobacter pinnipediorum subsp. caledonicus]
MRVLFIISTMQAGGAERVMSILASYFAKFHDVTLLKFDQKDSFYELDEKINIINLPYPMIKQGFFVNLKRRIKKFFYQRDVLKNGNFDVVISFMDSTNINVILSNLFINRPLFISEHSSSEFLKSKIWIFLRRILYPYANGLSVLTNTDFKYYDFVKNKIIMYNPVFDIKKHNIPKENIILFVGRLVKIKACDVFLNAIGLIDPLKLKGYKILIVGDGDQRQVLEKMAKNINADIEFLGNTNDISLVYEKSKIIVSSSQTEGLPNVLMESIFFDCARIGTATSGAKELIRNDFDGFIVPVNDFCALSEKIEKLIDDDVLRDKFIKNAHLRADDFKIENIYQKWMKFINSNIKKIDK